MDDGALIDNEDLRSTHMRAREVRGEVLAGPERRRRWSIEEKLRILAQSVAPGIVGDAGLPDTRHQQRAALHLAAAVSQRRVDRVCAGDGVTGSCRATGGFCAIGIDNSGSRSAG